MFAIKNEILDRKRFSTPNLKGATESVKRNALTVSQVTKILEIARTRYKITHYTALSLLFLTGMRADELRVLRWESKINFINKLIHTRRTKDRFGPRSPKTKNSYREFPMSKNIKSLFACLQRVV